MHSVSKADARRIVIVGGGFTGVSAAIQLMQACKEPLTIIIVESRSKIGYGVAYSTDDPDHRLNGVPETHCVDPHDPMAFQRWCDEQQVALLDPEARAENGQLFVRRKLFGDFMSETLATRSRSFPQHSLRHEQQVVARVSGDGSKFRILTVRGEAYAADLVILATGNSSPSLPPLFHEALRSRSDIVLSPFDLQRIRSIDRSTRVLVLGAGLTALDAVSTLLRQKHSGPITVLSRGGQRPRPQPPVAADDDAPPLIDLIDRAAPPYLTAAAVRGLKALVRELRVQIQMKQQLGGTWYEAFDELRNSVWRLWPRLSTNDKRRFLKRLRSWYDAHRFRCPPQNDLLVRRAEREGRVNYIAGRVTSVSTDGEIVVEMIERSSKKIRKEAFDLILNCVGLDPASGAGQNPVLSQLLRDGLATVDLSGVGFAVDSDCCSVGSSGSVTPRLYFAGPPTAGTFGDPLGGIFIAAQIRRSIPAWLRSLNIETFKDNAKWDASKDVECQASLSAATPWLGHGP